MPRITVLLPVYNAMPYLRYAVESLQQQTLPDFKVLVFNDGSTDGSGDYLDALDDPRFTIIHQENAGLAVTLNRMIPMVDTEYVARMDADDICLPERLEKQLAFMDAHPEVAVAGARQGYVAGRCWRASLAFGWRPLTPSYSPPMKKPPYWDPDNDGNILVHSAVIMRSDKLREVGAYPEIVPGQDLALWYRFAEAGHLIASMDEMLVLVRISPSGISSSNISRQYRTWEYIRMCHKQRSQGITPPTLDAYLKEHPQDHVLLDYRMLKAELRNACGMLLAGRLIHGALALVRVGAKDTGILSQKIRSRFRFR